MNLKLINAGENQNVTHSFIFFIMDNMFKSTLLILFLLFTRIDSADKIFQEFPDEITETADPRYIPAHLYPSTPETLSKSEVFPEPGRTPYQNNTYEGTKTLETYPVGWVSSADADLAVQSGVRSFEDPRLTNDQSAFKNLDNHWYFIFKSDWTINRPEHVYQCVVSIYN